MNKNGQNTKKVVFLTINQKKEVKVNEYTFSKEKKKKDIVLFLEEQIFDLDTNERFVSLLS